jgi:hypothetical protein
MAKRPTKMTEPAHSLMYTPGSLAAGKTFADTNQLYAKVTPYLKDAFNEKQESLSETEFLCFGGRREQERPRSWPGLFSGGLSIMPKREFRYVLASGPATTTLSITSSTKSWS